MAETTIPELTSEQVEDFKRLAEAQKTVKACNETVKTLAAKYRDFMFRFETILARGITLGPFRFSIQYTRKLVVEEL